MIRLIGRATKKYVKGLRAIFKYRSLFNKYKEYTMVPDTDYILCLDLVSGFKNVEGCVIECGVWRGGMIAGIAEVMGNQRSYHLFDSFEGLPPAKEIDGEAANAWQADKTSKFYYDNCAAEIEWAQKAMRQTGVNDANVHIVKGWFDDTVPSYKLEEPIALLRLDGDWYDSTMVCLERFFPQVVKGGVIILDDYYTWDGCTRALHDYLSRNQRPERIVQTYMGGCYLVKR